MIPTVMDEYILPVLIRYVDHYHWSWTISVQLINKYYGVDYTANQLKRLYQQKIKIPPPRCWNTEAGCEGRSLG